MRGSRILLTAVVVLMAGCTSATSGPPSALSTTPPATTSAAATSPATTFAATTTRTQAASTIGASSAETAPLASSAQVSGPSIEGCALFPATNPWREDVWALPVSVHSSDWVTSIGTAENLHPDYGSAAGIPITVAPAGQPTVPITFTDDEDQSDPGPYPIPADARVEDGDDRHVLVISADCRAYELFSATKTETGWSADSGAVFDLRTGALRPRGWTSADAAGLPILPGLVRKDEVDAGVIDHALRFTAARTQRGYLLPATHFASSSTDPTLPPMGARFRLKADVDLSGYTGPALTVLTALKKYGMFLADNGSNWFLSGTADTAWNDELNDPLKLIPGSDFEAVDTGTMCTDPDTQERPPC